MPKYFIDVEVENHSGCISRAELCSWLGESPNIHDGLLERRIRDLLKVQRDYCPRCRTGGSVDSCNVCQLCRYHSKGGAS